VSLEPANRDIAARLERVRREAASERTYSQTNAYSFDIRFDYKALSNGIIDLRDYLMQAYEKAGQEFNRFPDYPIVVILSDDNTFRMVNNAPAWVAGLYDGKIRIPVNFSRIPAQTLKCIVAHEYTHALVSDLSGGNCPIWLNEGLAMHSMNNPSLIAVDMLQQALKADRVLSIAQLGEQQMVWRNPAIVNLSYAQSWIMAEYLLSRWSAAQVKGMLEALKQGTAFERILLSTTNRTPEQFEMEWKTFAASSSLMAGR
jgi:hypothetical protein